MSLTDSQYLFVKAMFPQGRGLRINPPAVLVSVVFSFRQPAGVKRASTKLSRDHTREYKAFAGLYARVQIFGGILRARTKFGRHCTYGSGSAAKTCLSRE